MSKNDQEILQEVNTQYEFSKRYLDNVHDRMNKQEELYRCYIDQGTYPHDARVFDPRIFRIIETITPRMVANEPTGSFYPSEDGDVSVNEILNALIRYDWRRAEMFPKLTMFVKSMLLFGTAFGRTYWDFRECERTQMIPKNVDGKMIWTPTNFEKKFYTEFDGPNFEVLNIYDCFPDPNATSLASMRWFIYRKFMTLKELEDENDARGGEYWKNIPKLKAAIKDKAKESTKKGYRPSDINYREHRRTMLSTQELHGEDESNPEFVVLIRYDNDRWVFSVPEYGIIIRDVENPYFHNQLPIIYGVDYPYPGELYGMGEIEPIDRIQRAINAVLNQRLDNVQLVLRNMWKVKKNSGVDMHTLVSAPGNIVTTDDMTAIEALTVPDVTGPTFVQTMNYLTSAMQNGSGITDYTVGVGENSQSVANSTATGVRLVQQEANAQFKLKIQLFNHMVIERIANQWKDLRIQYTTETQKVRILGRNEVKYLMEKTDLATTGLEGEQIIPGDFETPTKLQVGADNTFAFLTLLPEDIQPSVVGNYDFIAAPSSEQLTDPIAMQENFFVAIERVSRPEWVNGLAQSGKQLNYAELTEKIFDKLNMGIELNDVLEDIQQPMMGGEQIGGQPGQPIPGGGIPGGIPGQI